MIHERDERPNLTRIAKHVLEEVFFHEIDVDVGEHFFEVVYHLPLAVVQIEGQLVGTQDVEILGIVLHAQVNGIARNVSEYSDCRIDVEGNEG
ncbi:hypothetical protein GCM10009000_051270 [Halobacterium noricense]|uniref:Halobacterial output domain-containing protein n=1 Tax=Haladaptatus pallidirubidus TaxID=1008152 RepID=A0AAV3UCZ9_9EURY